MTSYAVVLTHNRPDLLQECVAAISPQVDRVHVVDNASEPPLRRVWTDPWPLNMAIFEDPTQPPNLAKLWNDQLDLIDKFERFRGGTWEVAFLCDDSIVPPGWFSIVAGGIRGYGAAAGSTGPLEPRNSVLLQTTISTNVYERMCGWAFVVAGEKGLRADEACHWWYCDSDLDFQSRLAGGTVICPGLNVPNALPGQWTNAKPELGARAGLDRAAFIAKWGVDF